MLSEKEYREIKDRVEIVKCKPTSLSKIKKDSLKEDDHQRYQFDRFSIKIWTLVYEKLRLKGWSEIEAMLWVQSKRIRCLFDESEDVSIQVAQKIANFASKDQINDSFTTEKLIDCEIELKLS